MNEICKALHDAFAPVVNAVLKSMARVGLEYTTEVVEVEAGWMYAFKVIMNQPDGQTTAFELMHAATALEVFGGWEKGLGSWNHKVLVNGQRWIIGDGDDILAVVFREGAFHIWIRDLEEE